MKAAFEAHYEITFSKDWDFTLEKNFIFIFPFSKMQFTCVLSFSFLSIHYSKEVFQNFYQTISKTRERSQS